MGIFANTITLSSGVTLSNVYLSFSGEVVFVRQSYQPSNGQQSYNIRSFCNIFPDRESAKKGNPSEVRFEVSADVQGFSPGNPYEQLYNSMKAQYSNVADCYEISQPMSNLVVSGETIVSLFKDIKQDSNAYEIPTQTSNLVVSTSTYQEISNIISNLTFTPAPTQTE
jgi:hypothetical protein